MKELQDITDKYQAAYIKEALSSLQSLKIFAAIFYNDVAEIYDCLTRMKDVERNPSGFSIDDAPILGLLVRVTKLLKEVIFFYKRDNAEIISILERPLIEGAITATYLMQQDANVMLDYRKCSYKDRLRILRDLKSGSPFFDTKPGKRLLASVSKKLKFEGFTEKDFAEQKKNRWRLQGKTFFEIFAEVMHEDLYPSTYGMMSEAIHGSWAESLDWCLHKNEDGTFTPNLFSYPADIRFVTATLKFTNQPFRLWLQRIDCYDENTQGVLD